MGQYTPIITDAGLALIADSLVNGTPIVLKYFAIGDGGGDPVTPVQSQTSLVNEVFRTGISEIYVDPSISSWLHIKSEITGITGGFVIRETGVFTDNGVLFVVSAHPDFEKPTPIEGTALELKERITLEISNLDEINIQYDNSGTVTVNDLKNHKHDGATLNSPSKIDLSLEVQGVLPSSNIEDVYVFRNGDTLTGFLTLHADPTNNLHAVTKQYLDSAISNTVSYVDNGYISITGGTLTGFLTLHADPTNNLHAVTKQYVDSAISGVIGGTGASYLALSGGTMTGFVTLHADPTDDLHAVTKQYADTKLPLIGGTITGFLSLDNDPTDDLHAVTKQYADTKLPLTGGNMEGFIVFDNIAGIKGLSPALSLGEAVEYSQLLDLDSRKQSKLIGFIFESNIYSTQDGLLCNGADYLQQDYPELFQSIGIYNNDTFIINNTTNTITSTNNHNLTTGDGVFFDFVNTIPTGIQPYEVYYVNVIDSTNFTIHPTQSDAISNTNIIDIEDTGLGVLFYAKEGTFRVPDIPAVTPIISKFIKY